MMNVPCKYFADGNIAEIPIVGTAKRVVVNQAVPVKNFLPFCEKGKVFLNGDRKNHLVAPVFRNGNLLDPVRIGFPKGPADGSKHEDKTVRILEPFLYRRIQQLLIKKEHKLAVQMFLGKALVNQV